MSVLRTGVPLTITSHFDAQRGESKTDTSQDSDLIAALSGKDASRDRAIAYRTRRVVLGSLGVLKDQKRDRSRARGVALAVTLLVLALIAPLVWEVTDSLIAGEHLADPGSQLSLWACILCPTMLGAALVVGWMRKRS